MDIKSGHTSPVMTDSPPISNSRLTIRQNRVPYSSATALSQNNNLLLTVPRKKTGILDDVIKSNGWLDAMKSSSPPPSILNKDSSDASTDMTYREWTVCPLWFSLFSLFIVLILTHSCFSSSSIHQLLLLLRKSRVLQKAKE